MATENSPIDPGVRIGHVHLKVADIERALEFYRDRLGFAEMMRLNREDGSLWLVYLRITDTQFIELFSGGEGDRAPGSNARRSIISAWRAMTSTRPPRLCVRPA